MGKLSLSIQILLAVLIGTLLGIVLGPYCSIFKPIGSAFVMFIQMVILLYIPSLIIHGLGSTSPVVARHLFKKGWGFLVFIWGLIFFSIYLMNHLFPRLEVVFDASKVHSEFEQNFLSYLVPQNPIYDLANNIVPAVAIFAIIIGIALMHLTHKEPLISFLERVNSTIEKVLKGITRISPFGVAAIFASAVGNVFVEDLAEFAYFIIPTLAIAFLFTFWVLPALLCACTSLKYKEILSEFRSTCLLAFVIGAPSIAIPFLNNCIKHLAARFEIKDKELHSTTQMIVPLTYTFTQVGNLLILFFIMFLSYYYGIRLSGIDQTLVTILTLPMSFGGPELAISSIGFLVDKLGFPNSAIDLYDKTSVVTQNFQVLLSVASMTTFAILLVLAYYRRLTFRWGHFLKHFGPIVLLLFFGIMGTQQLLSRFHEVKPLTSHLSIEEILPKTKPGKVYRYGEKLPDVSYRTRHEDTITRIYSSNELYVGYHPNLPPFSYFNEEGELVGYDIAFAYHLADNMNVTPIFVPLVFDTLGPMLEESIIDIAAFPALFSAPSHSGVAFGQFYFHERNVLIVPRKHKNVFLNLEKLQKNRHLTIGTLGHFSVFSKRHFPLAQNHEIKDIWHIISDLEENAVDTVYWEKSQAEAFCRKNPNYVVIDYGKQIGETYLAFPVKFNAFDFIFYLNSWIHLAHDQGFDKQMYEYWMLGHPPERKNTRWSLIKALKN